MTIHIDGRPISFEGSPTLLEIARANDIFIPSLCDHPDLEPYAACRLCLVEVEGRRGYLPACSTRAEAGMSVRTKTPELGALRRGILELILSEHPNACLACAEKTSCDDLKSTIRKAGEVTGCVLCPANGRCQLQKVVEAIGLDRVHYPSRRRDGDVRRDDPFIDRDNSLCILCGRCVRACHEIRGASVLTFILRGSDMVVGTAADRRLIDAGCRFCGACVDVCPTGSLAERGVRYQPPSAEDKPALCPFCGQGCRLRLGLREGRVLGAVPDPGGAANRGQACVKGRFLVKEAVDHPSRLLQPLIRREGRLQPASWAEALAAAAEGLARIEPTRIAVTGSAQSSCEDLFVLHRFAADVLKAGPVAGRWLGSAAAALRGSSVAAGPPAALNFELSELGRAETILIVGESLVLTQPLVGLEVQRAVRRGAVFIAIGMEGGLASVRGRAARVVPRGEEAAFLEAAADAVSALGRPASTAARRRGGNGGRRLSEIGRLIASRKPPLILFGPSLLEAGRGRRALDAARRLAALTQGRLIPLDGEANVRGGLEIAAAFAKGPAVREPMSAAFYYAGASPRTDRDAAAFVVVQGSYLDERAAAADILLPETIAFEAEGTFVNVEGRIQLSEKAVDPPGQAKPGWLILCELAEAMGAAGFGWRSAAAVRGELARAAAAFENIASPAFAKGHAFLVEGGAGGVGAPGGPPAGPGDPDDYKGLALARVSKGLRIIRGR
jgi:NADH dehydrogenase/NADH:ubiquinone oxidoreductase subunit G